jgi:hypothetical protein
MSFFILSDSITRIIEKIRDFVKASPCLSQICDTIATETHFRDESKRFRRTARPRNAHEITVGKEIQTRVRDNDDGTPIAAGKWTRIPARMVQDFVKTERKIGEEMDHPVRI